VPAARFALALFGF